ncbi:MAG: hypothetical protein KC636_40045, partial [Myxococcales bacterium]|nr:hypothetical protein [Myxococcales bacterium]
GDGDGDGDGDQGLWILTVDDQTNPNRIVRIDVMTGAGAEVCKLNNNDGYNTSTFNRDGYLFAHNFTKAQIELIDPCTCQITVIGPTGVGNLPGITADQEIGLYGIEVNADNFVSVDTESGMATIIGAMGVNFGTGGLTWSDTIKQPYAINGSNDVLYVLDTITGAASSVANLNYNFGTVGIELHPKNGVIYACSNADMLFAIDPGTGDVTGIGPIGLTGACDNLAAPWKPVACLDDFKP